MYSFDCVEFQTILLCLTEKNKISPNVSGKTSSCELLSYQPLINLTLPQVGYIIHHSLVLETVPPLESVSHYAAINKTSQARW